MFQKDTPMAKVTFYKLLILLRLLNAASSASYRFALVPKQINNPFFDVVDAGCQKEAELTDVECVYVGPEVEEITEQVSIIRDLIEGVKYGKIDGISLSVAGTNDEAAKNAMNEVIEESIEAGIPLITFDSDAANSKRQAYIGTNNYALGQELGKVLDQLDPQGGAYGLIGTEAPNIEDRLKGVRDALKDTQWVEAVSESYPEFVRSPQNCSDSSSIALEIMDNYTIYSDVKAIVPLGGWPMFTPDGWITYVDKYRDREERLTLVCADTLDMQLDLMNKNYVNGLVGQLPYEMGSVSVETLLKLVQGESVGEEIFGTAVLQVLRFPIDLDIQFPLEVDPNYIGSLAILGYVLFCIIAVSTLFCLGWTYYNRSIRVVKASQPEFLAMICVGVLIMSISILTLTIDGENHEQSTADSACMSTPWLLTLGFTTAFSALFAKTWRVNKIFHSARRFVRIQVKAKDVIPPYFGLMTVNVISLTCWTIIAPLTYQRSNNPGTDLWNRVISTYGICESKGDSPGGFLPYLLVIVVTNMGLLVLANVQSYQARSIETEYSESKYISFIMASLLQACFIGIPIILLTYKIPQTYFVIMSSLIFVVCMSVLSLIFVPKIIYLKAWHIEQAKKRMSSGKGGKVLISSMSTGEDQKGLKLTVMKAAEYTDVEAVKSTTVSAEMNKSSEGLDESEEERSSQFRQVDMNGNVITNK